MSSRANRSHPNHERMKGNNNQNGRQDMKGAEQSQDDQHGVNLAEGREVDQPGMKERNQGARAGKPGGGNMST
jgi:hypothetical protein